MRYAIVTFGCRVNQADSLALEDGLRSRGLQATRAEAADVVVVNTCSVTGTADQAARQVIRRIARANPSAGIIITGCYATREPRGVAVLPGVVRVVANDNKESLAELVARRVPGAAVPVSGCEVTGSGCEITPSSDAPVAWHSERQPDTGHPEPEPITRHREPGTANPVPGTRSSAFSPGAGRTAYTLRVQTGCDERCAFCIVPATRGRSRSAPLAAVVTDVRRLAAQGFKDVTLTGVHLGAYGRDLEPQLALVDLLRSLANVPEDIQVRISSLEPMDCSQGIVDLVARSGRFAPHFHLPLQHASDRLLNLMRRPYTLDVYRRLVDSIREQLPHAAIGGDVVVGFPSETDDDHEALLHYLSGSPLTHLHVFRYSDRPGTAASAMPGKVDGRTMNARAARLRRVGHTLWRRFQEAQLGSTRSGLTLEDGSLVVTDNYLKVRIPPGRARNERVRVRIESVAPDVRGRVVSVG